MVDQSQTVFYIERIQKHCLSTIQNWMYILIIGLIGGLIGGLIFGILFKLTTGIISSLIVGLILALIVKLSHHIEPYEAFALKLFSWCRLKQSLKNGLIVGLIVGAIVGLIVGGIDNNLISGLIFALIFGLIFGFLVGVVESLRTEMIDRQVPNQGIWASAKSIFPIFVLTLPLWIVGMWTIAWLQRKFGVGTESALHPDEFIRLGIAISMTINLVSHGSYACIHHIGLRITLYLNRHIPWNYAKFLDYCTQLILLRRIGGGYIFVHRLLLEHIATHTPNC
jgi:hypothetical protein